MPLLAAGAVEGVLVLLEVVNMKLKSKKFVKRETEAEPKPQNELFEIRGTDMVTLPRGKRRRA